ncbi:phage tail protein [Polluticoccus soli]|uniref:phage tail protein n=1 Tax=Polluticoccus soli TaxID=3034150 RepID=UPI0023E31EB2|nr:tail fiber protein [Flavipsychrobacter sp. JY13-12]
MFVEPYLGTVTIFAGNFAPVNWMLCQGQAMPISEYTALFSLIGTTYGGDGQTTFNLPDFRGRCAIHQGQGTGLSPYYIGQIGGTEAVTLLSTNLPTHNHPIISVTANQPVSTADGTTDDPTNAYPASVANHYSAGFDGSMNSYTSSAATPVAGGSQPIEMHSPYLAMNYVIAVEGIFPSRN